MASPSSAGPEGVQKMRLQNAPMFVNRLRGGREQRYASILFAFKDFTRLKRDYSYTKADFDIGWMYILTKGEEDATIELTFLFTRFNEKFQRTAKCYVGHQNHGDYHECGRVVQKDKNTCQITVPLKSVEGPEFLSEDVVVHIQIRFSFDRQRNVAVSPLCGDIKDLCLQQLSTDLSSMEAKDWNNFMIFDSEQVRLAPKGLCAARSSVLRDYLTNHRGATGFVLPVEKFSSSAEIFMTSGKLLVPIDTQSVVDLLNFSDIMGIPSLKSLCSVVFQDDLDVIYD